jgi:hypothetical protein
MIAALAVIGIVVTIGYMIHGIVTSPGMEYMYGMPTLPPLAGVHAMAREVNVPTRSPSGNGTEVPTEAVPANFFDKEATDSDIPDPTDLLANKDTVVDKSGASVFEQPQVLPHTHSVPAVTDGYDIKISARDFNDATTRMVQLAADLINQPAHEGVTSLRRQDAHMRVDVARRLLAQVTTLVSTSQDMPYDGE